MNLPNKLTVLRILLIPVIVIVYYVLKPFNHISTDEDYKLALTIIGGIFIVASFTDFLDGYIARKYNLVTTFGKFIDPLADKMLVFSALIILQDLKIVSAWIIIVILIREFTVSGVRMICVEKGKVIAAGVLGKIKTVVTMVAIICLLFGFVHDILALVGCYLMYVAVFFTVISGIEYIYKNKEIILESK